MFANVLLLSCNQKIKIHTSRIKRFDSSTHSPYQKYKVIRSVNGKNKEEDCVVLHLAENEEELNKAIDTQRAKRPSSKMLISASESTDDEETSPQNYHTQKRKSDGDGEPHLPALIKRLMLIKQGHNKESSSFKVNNNSDDEEHSQALDKRLVTNIQIQNKQFDSSKSTPQNRANILPVLQENVIVVQKVQKLEKELEECKKDLEFVTNRYSESQSEIEKLEK
ncbi:uncharacterized protein LOC127279139 [Leptopilina boulardi]|uniref:uncharacterized protein LOC127279139 n=1 Tax=Leptopilina boulardi TaxID=63433 RepID=UPI0021F5DF57|nr:uncharacterized protein LOC127279139 [Leptopilina boulardi]